MHAKLIMIDGPDGVGKTTQIKLITQKLLDRRLKVVATRINGGSPIGEALRSIYLGNLERPVATDFYLGQAIFCAFEAEVAKLRSQCDVILVDRSPYSNVVYQGYAGGYPVEEILDACAKTGSALAPDAVIFYDAPTELLHARRKGLDPKIYGNYFEDKPASYHAAVIEGYRTLAAQFSDITVVNANTNPTAVNNQTMSIIDQIL